MLPNEIEEAIVRDVFGLANLESCHQDALDFLEVPVWALRQALTMAYEAGINAIE